MVGRLGTALLAICFLLPAQDWLHGQSGRINPGAEHAHPLPPRAAEPPTVERPATDSPTMDRFPRPWPVNPTPPVGFSPVVHSAGTIFSGTVTAIKHRTARSAHTVETVAITFHVEKAIRGVIPGESLTISQWIGVWSSGQRYRVGEHVLLFLYPPSKLGLTSCVSGNVGRFAVDERGRVLLAAHQLSAFRADPVLGGRSRLSFRDFARAVRQASEEE